MKTKKNRRDCMPSDEDIKYTKKGFDFLVTSIKNKLPKECSHLNEIKEIGGNVCEVHINPTKGYGLFISRDCMIVKIVEGIIYCPFCGLKIFEKK